MRLQGIIRKIKQNGEQKVVNETVLRMLMEFQECFLSSSSKVSQPSLPVPLHTYGICGLLGLLLILHIFSTSLIQGCALQGFYKQNEKIYVFIQ